MKNHPLLVIGQSRFGKGLFADASIAAGTVICKVSGKQMDFHTTLQMNEKESHGLQIDFDSYILCEAPFLYSNHSCEPNCALNKKLEMFALRDIAAGEELLWDYSTSMLERHWTMQCACGSSNCRQVIRDFDLLPMELQRYYLRLGIVLPFIERFVQQQLAKSA